MHRVALYGLFLLGGPADTPPSTLGPIATFSEYGPAEPVELTRIAYDAQRYHRNKVLTKATLKPLPGSLDRFLLEEETARVLAIPMPELTEDSRRLLGRRIEVEGIVRVLPAQQKLVPCRNTLIVESKCIDPDLPELPNAQPTWPSASITIIRLVDAGPMERAGPAPDGVSLEELAGPDTPYAGQTVRVVGLFGGRNLFGDLPPGSASTPLDWVLRQPPHAIWVTGRKPEGKGWRLDPAYKGDGVRWIEVTGRVEVKGGVSLLRASKVLLVSAPREAEP